MAGGATGAHSASPRGGVTILLSGLGLLTDTYDLQVINLARAFIAVDHPMRAEDEVYITASAVVGAIVGMLVFGALADALGRRAIFITTALLTTLGAFGSALVSSTLPFGSVYTQLAMCRLLMGLGIGGEYPLSAANTAEHSAAAGGRQLAITFSMMGWGGLLAPVVFIVLKLAGASAQATWRLGFAVGGGLSLLGAVLRAFLLRDADKFVAAKEQEVAAAKRHIDEAASVIGSHVRSPGQLLGAHASDGLEEEAGASFHDARGTFLDAPADQPRASDVERAPSPPHAPTSAPAAPPSPPPALAGKHAATSMELLPSRCWSASEDSRPKDGRLATRPAAGATRALRLGSRRESLPHALAVTTAHHLARYWRPLVGTSLCWLLFDIYEYGLNLYTSDIAHALSAGSGGGSGSGGGGGGGGGHSAAAVHGAAGAHAQGTGGGGSDAGAVLDPVVVVLLIRLFTMPGYLLGIFAIHKLGRRETMSCGFAAMGVFFCAFAALWPTLQQHGRIFVALFGVSQVLNYAGAAVATYVLPGEMYASAMRATCHGISAASGKLGAAVGSAAFPIVAQRCGLRVVFALCAAVCALGWLVSEACLPSYDDQVTADLDRAHADDRFLEHLYAPTETRRQSSLVRLWRWMRARGDAGARPDAGCLVVAVLVAVLTIGMGLALAYGRA